MSSAIYDETNRSIFVSNDATSFGNVTAIITYGASPAPTMVILTVGYTSQPAMPTIDIYYDNIQVQ